VEERKGRNGARKGNTFYGCSNYPKVQILPRAHKPIRGKKLSEVAANPFLVEKYLKAGAGWIAWPEQGM